MNNESYERVVVVGVQTDETDYDFDYSLEELKNLITNAHGEVVGEVTQKRDSIDHKTFVGKGKLNEIKNYIDELDVTTVVFNQELSPSHMRNIQEVIDAKVLDRIQVILDIFALRARSKEGRLQVQLAQLNYTLPRLAGTYENLSRLGGGIGTRGPGETKLETDRRHIQKQITDIKRELKKVESHRERSRQKRQDSQVIQIGIIGYTNAGKSTLLNQLTEAGTLEKDILFATLDPLSRKLTLPSGITVIITDTVGFIKDLPTQLIESFKSTLEETRNSDMILHIVDGSNENILSHEETVEELLRDLEMNQIPKMTIYNKADLMKPNFTPLSYPNTIVSAFNKEDMNRLRREMEEFLISNMTYYAASIPSYRGDVLAQLKQETIMIKQKYDKAEQVYDVAGYAKEDSYWIHKLSKDEFQ